MVRRKKKVKDWMNKKKPTKTKNKINWPNLIVYTSMIVIGCSFWIMVVYMILKIFK